MNIMKWFTAVTLGACIVAAQAATEGKLLGAKEVATGLNSFTVEGLVKTPEIHYFTFAGNRTVAPWYNVKGWNLGLTKTGRFSAVIGDGENRAYTWWDHIKSPWESGEWNHVAMTRDAETGALTLYVNGVKGPNPTKYVAKTKWVEKPFPIDVTCASALQVGGLDAMTGNRFRGEIGDFTVTAGVLSAGTIAAHAKAALAGLPKDTSLALAAAPVTVASAPPLAPVPLELTPRPKEACVSSEVVAIPPTWTAEGLDARGLAALDERLSLECGMTNAPGGVRFVFKDAKGAHPEEFALQGGLAADGAYEVRVTADGAVRYAAIDAIGQIFRIASLANGRKLSAPKSFAVTDWPSMPVRMAVTPFGTLWETESFEEQAREVAFMRMNAVHLSTGKILQKRLETFCRSFSAFGIDTISWIAYMGADSAHPFSPLDPVSMDALRKWVEKDGEAGVKGFTVAFDDLSGPYLAVADRAAEKAKYGSLGKLHNAVTEKVREFARPYPIQTWLTIPFEYSVCSQEQAVRPGDAYYREFTQGFRDAGIVMLHTGFSQQAVDQLKAAGAETYGYYVNGTWPTKLFFTWYMGMERLAWTWNMFYCDRNGNGPVPYADMIAEVKTIDRRSSVFFGAASCTVSRYMAGWFPWNPSTWDETRAGRALAQRFYGSGVYEPLDRYARAVAPMVGYFMTYKTSWTGESKAPDSARIAPLTKSEFLGYWRNLGQAKEARTDISSAIDAQTSVFDRPSMPADVAKSARRNMLQSIDSTLEEIEAKLRFLAKRKGIELE